MSQRSASTQHVSSDGGIALKAIGVAALLIFAAGFIRAIIFIVEMFYEFGLDLGIGPIDTIGKFLFLSWISAFALVAATLASSLDYTNFVFDLLIDHVLMPVLGLPLWVGFVSVVTAVAFDWWWWWWWRRPRPDSVGIAVGDDAASVTSARKPAPARGCGTDHGADGRRQVDGGVPSRS